MGITVHYRGRIADLDRVEDFEDRVLDLAVALQGSARIWRSCPKDDNQRMVRGLILDLAPGQESTSLLISPEGWLIGLIEIEDAEQRRIAEAPWCFVKTQFGPIEGHVALVELLRAIKREFAPDLEVSDEGGYYETGDLAELRRRFKLLQAAIAGLADGLRRHSLSHEAAEDPEILTVRIRRIAEQVQRTLSRPAEHPPVEFSDADEEFAARKDAAAIEADWDEFYKDRRRAQERLHRSIEERLARGEDHEQAFEGAMRDLGVTGPPEEGTSGDEDGSAGEDISFADELFAQEDWEEELIGEGDEESALEREEYEEDEHPLSLQARKLWTDLHHQFRKAENVAPQAIESLFHGLGDMCGGLAQALPRGGRDIFSYGLAVVQFKRALRGIAFARGALFNLQSPEILPDDLFKSFMDRLEEIEREVLRELEKLRTERERRS